MLVLEFSKYRGESFLPETVGLTGDPSGVLSGLFIMTISCINNAYLNKGTTVTSVHVENPSFVSNSEEIN